MALEQREHVRPVVVVRPDGPLTGHTFHMHRVPASTWVTMRRGELDNGILVEQALAAVVESTVPADELDMHEVLALTEAWIGATFEDALPPADGTSSPKP